MQHERLHGTFPLFLVYEIFFSVVLVIHGSFERIREGMCACVLDVRTVCAFESAIERMQYVIRCRVCCCFFMNTHVMHIDIEYIQLPFVTLE